MSILCVCLGIFAALAKTQRLSREDNGTKV